MWNTVGYGMVGTSDASSEVLSSCLLMEEHSL